MSYAELHCLSGYTFLRAASHPHELVERAADALPGRNDPTGLLSKFGEALCNLCSNGKSAAT